MSDDDKLAAVLLIGTIGFILLYWLPTFIAFHRRHPNRWLIAAVNGFLGASGIGWAVALVWAFNAAVRDEAGESAGGGVSGMNLFADDVWRVRVEGAGGEIDPMPVVTPRMSPGEALAEIERLARLRAQGAFSENEFSTLKAEVLARL